jgi:acyl carrier protein
VIICNQQDQDLHVDTFLLSCRVLGRGVEHLIAAFLGETARQRGLSHVVFRYRQTKRNSPARDFLESMPFGERMDDELGFVLRIPASELAAFRWSAPERATAPRSAMTTAATRRSVDYAFIANHLASAGAILHAMRTSYTPQTDASMTVTEAALARIWSELLERRSVSVTDNFFDLGGHSLLAVLLLLRIRESFGVELSIDDVYSGTLTLADLATRIETAQLGDLDPAEYAALLAEIEGLSEEEARALLATEDSANN